MILITKKFGGFDVLYLFMSITLIIIVDRYLYKLLKVIICIIIISLLTLKIKHMFQIINKFEQYINIELFFSLPLLNQFGSFYFFAAFFPKFMFDDFPKIQLRKIIATLCCFLVSSVIQLIFIISWKFIIRKKVITWIVYGIWVFAVIISLDYNFFFTTDNIVKYFGLFFHVLSFFILSSNINYTTLKYLNYIN